MVADAKARQAGDLTIGEAEGLHAQALRLKREWETPYTIWAMLMGLPWRRQNDFMALYKVKTTWEVAEVIARLDPGAAHG